MTIYINYCHSVSSLQLVLTSLQLSGVVATY